ncbi:MAG TPA: transketolase [Pseudonocardia sp.]|nr:transketolase [Pseudonocardia sp.]
MSDTIIAELTQRSVPEDWTELDSRAVDTIRVLAADAVQKTGNGHPGTAMSLAPVAYSLFQRVMRHDPSDPNWAGRDRFVLSCGHSSLTLYIQLFLTGYGMTLHDLESLRTWGSQTPGHPEHGHTPGVEMTTGPLGQGLASAVGMSIASRRERGLLDPDAPLGESPFDHHIYVLASDGDMEEGITSEASSLAGTLQLGNLTVIYDDNHISIEDDTAVALSEDVGARYEAYGWHVQRVHGGENVTDILKAIEAANAVTDRPSFIQVRTIIGYPAPTKMNSGKAHGAALGADEVAGVKRALNFDPEQSFVVEDKVLEHTRAALERGKKAHADWQVAFDSWAKANPARAEFFDRLTRRELPAGWHNGLPAWDPADEKNKGGVATRKAFGAVVNGIADALPELWGGSADLAESNNTTIEGADSFGPPSIVTKDWGPSSPYGRTLHFGIREHAMGAILNGITLHGGTRPYGGTFLVFSDYMRGSVRLAALMKLPVVYVWTHDSIGLGEDGPTHQPIEHLPALRVIPGLNVLRPADANETAHGVRHVLDNPVAPTGIALSRQNLPLLEGTSFEGVSKGAYVLADFQDPTAAQKVIIMGSGSEVQLAVQARERLAADGISARVVSVPCLDWFEQQDEAYRLTVLPPEVRARVAVEAAHPLTWYRWVGDAGKIIGIDHFGASADQKTLYQQFGITTDAVVDAARATLQTTSS